MRKGLALLVIALLFVLALVPAYYQPDDEALGRSLNDGYNQLFTAVNPFFDLNLNHDFTGLPLAEITFRLPQVIPSASETRAPPA